MPTFYNERVEKSESQNDHKVEKAKSHHVTAAEPAEKGGPGSGPHPGYGDKVQVTNPDGKIEQHRAYGHVPGLGLVTTGPDGRKAASEKNEKTGKYHMTAHESSNDDLANLPG